MLSSALCFVFLFSGYCGLAVSPEVVTTCLSTMLRSLGSSVLWVYSTLLLQLRVPDGLLGRMLALEVAFFTVSNSDPTKCPSCYERTSDCHDRCYATCSASTVDVNEV